MHSVEGTIVQKGTGRSIGYHVACDVVDNHVNYKARIGDATAVLENIEGQFDFDPSKLDVDAAVESFLQARIDKANYGAA